MRGGPELERPTNWPDPFDCLKDSVFQLLHAGKSETFLRNCHMSVRFRFYLVLSVFLCLAALSGCRTFQRDDFPRQVARFYVETSEMYPERFRASVTLPYSESTIQIDPSVQIAEWDINDVQVFEAELGPAIAFILTTDAARDIRMLTYSNQGRRLVLVVNEVPVGAKMIDRGIEDGIVSLYLEVPDEELEDLATNIKKTSELVRRRM